MDWCFDTLICPCHPATLHCASTITLYFAQAMSESLCGKCEGLDGSELFNDRSSPVVFDARPGSADTKRHYVYVDNLGALGSQESWSKAAQESMAVLFNQHGLATHGDDASTNRGEILGVETDGENLENEAELQNAVTVRGAISAIL